MNSKYVIGGFILVITCVLIYRTVAPNIITDKSLGFFRAIVETAEDTFGISHKISEEIRPFSSRSDILLYYCSQIGMLLGVIIIVIGIFSVEGNSDLFGGIRNKFSHREKVQKKEIIHEKKDKEFSEHIVFSSMPLEIRELATKHKKGEISKKELKNMFIRGEITWDQYNKILNP
ncbi:MAG: hypothetical protein PVF58_13980 [Candidatus Methanofastidiosia archaeon]|jgi:hypothetical protein